MLIEVHHDTSWSALFTFIHRGEDADYEAYALGVRRLLQVAPIDSRPIAILCDPQLVHPAARVTGSPTAHQRSLIAGATKDVERTDGLFCMVTSSRAVRGVLTAVHWIRAANYEFFACPSFAAADEWLLEKRPGRKSPIRELQWAMRPKLEAELRAATG